jgi:transposase-like protein
MTSTPWSPEDDDRLRGLALSGLSVTEIAHELGRNRSSVYRRAASLKIVIARDRIPRAQSTAGLVANRERANK